MQRQIVNDGVQKYGQLSRESDMFHQLHYAQISLRRTSCPLSGFAPLLITGVRILEHHALQIGSLLYPVLT